MSRWLPGDLGIARSGALTPGGWGVWDRPTLGLPGRPVGSLLGGEAVLVVCSRGDRIMIIVAGVVGWCSQHAAREAL